MTVGFQYVRLLYQLYRLKRNAGRTGKQVKQVISCGEPLGAGLRKYLENAFRAEVINFYGASESLALGVEQRADEGMRDFAMQYLQEHYRGIDVHTNRWSGLDGIVFVMHLLIAVIYLIAAVFIMVSAALVSAKLLQQGFCSLSCLRTE